MVQPTIPQKSQHNLIDKHFPKDNKLDKIFNKNSVIVSYFCIENMK